MTSDVSTLDMQTVETFAQEVAGQVMGAVTTAAVIVGDELGLYAALAEAGPSTPAELAARTGTHTRYLREWLAQQAASGFVRYEADTGRFTLPPEHAAVLATDDSPAAMAGAALLPAGMFRGVDRMVEAFRTGAGVPWSDHDEAIFESTERFFKVGYRNSLITDWIPALDGVDDKLTDGARVADVGTGRGAPLLLLAEAYPRSEFVGYDTHEPSIDVARERAAAAGVTDRVRFEVADATRYPVEGYDLICYFDTFHDLGDPVSAAVHARHALATDGTLMLVEPMAMDDLATNLSDNPFAAMNYGASLFLCVANSLAQPVGLALGAQAGASRLAAVLDEAGYDHVRWAAESPFHMVLEAGP